MSCAEPSIGRALAVCALLSAACAACADTTRDAHTLDGAPPMHDAGDAFGSVTDSATAAEPMQTLIDDGGAALLPDGAVIYLTLWARPCPSASTLTYESFGQAFVAAYCLHCHSSTPGTDRHGAPAGINFDALDAIRAGQDAIWSLAADDHTLMPAAGPAPSADERRLLGDWLACGAKSERDALAR